ncbi:unnamed protein product [Cylicocyclus nassatus]|uniref:Uncharacterized protein n=1 Tax=Cylicocyclus nassatus TaxID=53992 RepID=A0AA36GFV6_CYLNA|nr:unnamed protein product [Cylicocyclus nassatus]
MWFINVYILALLVCLCHGRLCPSNDPECREAALENGCSQACRKKFPENLVGACTKPCKDLVKLMIRTSNRRSGSARGYAHQLTPNAVRPLSKKPAARSAKRNTWRMPVRNPAKT